MPNAASIIGEDTPGAVPFKLACNGCGIEGHRRFECPTQYYKDHGACMPGFNSRGERVAAAWNGNNITNATKENWMRLRAQGQFLQPPNEEDPASMPDLRP